MIKYGSICSGIEAASVAWEPLGWQPSFFAEIDKFPSAVLAHRFPDVPNAGDFTKIQKGDYDRIDLLVGGTPCQDFSVAGKRAGFDGSRGGLTFAYVDLVRCLCPRWIVWENVPGVLSGDCRRGFFRFLQALSDCGYVCCWRVLDAQYVRVDGLERAVPQRRRRVFVVGYLGDWRPPAAVLFEPESVRGDSPPSRKAGKGIARDVANSLASSGCRSGARTGDTGGQDNVVLQPWPAECASTLNAHYGDKWGLEDQHVNEGSLLHVPFAFSCKDNGSDAASITPTLRGMNNDRSHQNGGGQAAVAMHETGQGFWQAGDVSGTLRAEGENRPSRPSNVIRYSTTVRRLTPRECERLQGFPDDWTRIPWRGKEPENCPDGPRYKAVGNSMAGNCMRWIGERIQTVDIFL